MMICQERNCKITKLIFGFVMLVIYVLCLVFSIKSYLQNGLEFYSIGFGIYFPILQIIISFVLIFSTILSMAPFILIMLSFKRSQNSETLNENKSVNRTIKNVPETIMKYKELLDCGIISEEEFEIKKSQLLNKN